MTKDQLERILDAAFKAVVGYAPVTRKEDFE